MARLGCLLILFGLIGVPVLLVLVIMILAALDINLG